MNVHNFEVSSIDGRKIDLSDYNGKVLLIVNTASECGYTKQYADLQALYDTYKERGFVMLGFPSNDFGAQEPGSDAEIKKFCELKFNVKFPMYSKVVVKGPSKVELFKHLTETSSPAGEIAWNFEKFLVDAKGAVIGRYKSSVNPTDPQIKSLIEKNLVAKK